MFSTLSEKNLFPVRGNFDDFVFTDLTLKHYLNWISEAAKIMPQKIINATAGGAFIPNTEYCSLKTLNNKFKIINKNKILDLKKEKKIYIHKLALACDISQNILNMNNILNKVNEFIKQIQTNEKFNDIFFESAEVLKNKIISSEFQMLDIYFNRYYMARRELESHNLQEYDYKKNDMLLFFLYIKDGIEKTVGYLNKLIGN